MIVVDTNVVSEPLKAEPNAAVIAWLRAHGDDALVTAITVSELIYGVERLAPSRRQHELRSAVEALVEAAGDRVLAFDGAAAREAATLRAHRESTGRHVSAEDTMIAGICRAGGHRLATRNVTDFGDAGIDVVNPWDL